MRKRLPGCDFGSTMRLLPVRAVFWLAVFALTLMPVGAIAGNGDASSLPAHEAAGFVKDGAAPFLLAAAAPQSAAAPDAEGDAASDDGAPTVAEDAAQEANGPAQAQKQPPAAAPKNSIRIFNTVEFRGALKNMPKWQRVVTAEQKSRTFDGDLSGLMRGNVFKQWQQLTEKVKGASDLEKAKAVTAFFNRWPYKTDQAVYKVADYWATPKEFMKNSGDCEDYAITKFYALMKLGVDPDNMRIVALKDTIRNLAHAILVIYTNNDAYVLDNLTDMVLTHARYTHYLPQYSVNEVYRWAHVRPKKKK